MPPTGREVVLTSLPASGPRVERVDLLGGGELSARQDAGGLAVRLPERALGEVYVLRLSGAGLAA